MSISPFFQRDLFAGDAALSGWPSDGFDEPDFPTPAGADLRAASSSALRVTLARGPRGRHEEGVPPWALSAAVDGAEPVG